MQIMPFESRSSLFEDDLIITITCMTFHLIGDFQPATDKNAILNLGFSIVRTYSYIYYSMIGGHSVVMVRCG